MAVRNQHEVGVDLVDVNVAGQLVLGDERVKEERAPCRADGKTTVSIKRHFHKYPPAQVSLSLNVLTIIHISSRARWSKRRSGRPPFPATIRVSSWPHRILPHRWWGHGTCLHSKDRVCMLSAVAKWPVLVGPP